MTPQEQLAIDAACAALYAIAKLEGVFLGVWIGPDGRVDISATASDAVTKWVARGDMLDGGAHPRPGAALAARNHPAAPESSGAR